MRIPSSGAANNVLSGNRSARSLHRPGRIASWFRGGGQSYPRLDGTAATATPGSLLVINSSGKLIQSFTGTDIQGPWDAAIVDGGNVAAVFVANALNGTVSRLDFAVSSSGLKFLSSATIASGYKHQPDPAALFDAPTGLVYDIRRDTLFVASTR